MNPNLGVDKKAYICNFKGMFRLPKPHLPAQTSAYPARIPVSKKMGNCCAKSLSLVVVRIALLATAGSASGADFFFNPTNNGDFALFADFLIKAIERTTLNPHNNIINKGPVFSREVPSFYNCSSTGWIPPL
jgi:hypothetical protein